MLLASIHDVAPRFLPVVQRLREDMTRSGVNRVTLLVVPDFHGEDPLEHAPETVRWLRERADAGDEIALHGYHHIERNPIPGAYQRLRATLLSAGEAEYLSLARHERRERLLAGRELLQALLGRSVQGFVAPAWLEPPGFAAELDELGFGWHETNMYIERLGSTPQRVYAPVIGFATRTWTRRIAAIAWAGALAPLSDIRSRLTGVPVRVALHPGDASNRHILDTALTVLRRLARMHTASSVASAVEAR